MRDYFPNEDIKMDINKTIYTIEEVKSLYHIELTEGNIDQETFEDYLKDKFIQTYDDSLNFLGYEKVEDESWILLNY